MKTFAALVVLVAASAVAMPGQAGAVGCLSGAAVGGVAGHVAGHHALLGAAAGCVVGHHAKVMQRRRAAAAAAQSDPAYAPSR
jgi:hypothetical protein